MATKSLQAGGANLTAQDQTDIREQIGLGDSATKNVGTTAGTVAAGDAAASAAAAASTAQATATSAASAASAAQTTATAAASAATTANNAISVHAADTANPHAVTKTHVGLSNVENKTVAVGMGDATAAASSKATPVDADVLPISDSAASGALKGLTWANLKAAAKAVFDALYALKGAATGSGLTMTTARLLGRSTAGTGAIEEITLGTNLSFSGTTLNAVSGAGLSANTFTDLQTLPSLAFLGNISLPAWTTGGIGIRHTARTFTDTTSSGTVAAAYSNVLGGNTIAASAATTFTNYASLFLGDPTAGTNVTLTNGWSLWASGNVRAAGLTLAGSLSVATGGNIALSPSGFVSNLIDFGGASGVYFVSSQIWGPRVVGSNPLTFRQNGIVFDSASYLGFGSADASSTADVRLWRDAANVLAQRNGTAAQALRVYGTWTDASNGRWLESSMSTAGLGVIKPTGNGTGASGNLLALQTGATTVASLPAAASYPYARLAVTDATSTTFLSTVAGGGANKVPVVSDGTNWLIG